jgi:hypothetical protein
LKARHDREFAPAFESKADDRLLHRASDPGTLSSARRISKDPSYTATSRPKRVRQFLKPVRPGTSFEFFAHPAKAYFYP